jgi:hypothetical protein
MQTVEMKKTVTAFQWNGEEQGLPDGFYLCHPEVHYSVGRDFVYFTYANLSSRYWISAEKFAEKPESNTLTGALEITLKDGRKYWRIAYPFAFYSIKSEASVNRDHRARYLNRHDEEELNEFLDFATLESWGDSRDGHFRLPPRLEHRKVDGSYGRGFRPYYMKPTDWILIDGDNIEVVSDEEFQKLQIS